MNKKRHFLFTLIVTILCVSMVFFAVACDKKDTSDNSDPSTTTDELFTNGEFTLFTGESFPKTPNSWTSAAGSSSSVIGSDNIAAGVIDTEGKSFNSNKKNYGKIDNPSAGADKDSYILMIYNKAKTSYKYTSASISLDKSSYYKLSFNVKTLLDVDETTDVSKQGAYALLNGDAFAAFKGINTNGEWHKYEVYIETSQISSSSISLVLSLGNGTDFSKGHAFFDNVALEKLSEDGKFTDADYKKVSTSDNVAKYSMLAGDSEFDAVSGSSTILSPSKYNGFAGSGSGDSAPSSSSYVDKGVYDISKTATISNNDKNISLSKPEDSIGNNILVINNKQATAYGYRSSVPMRFSAKGYYAVSVKVRTENIESGGAIVKLTNGKNDDDRNFLIKDINSTEAGKWETVTLYIQSNETRNNDLYLEMWLGQGGKNDTSTHIKGVAMFDCVNIEKITEEKYNEQADNIKFSLKSQGTTPIKSDKFENTTYDDTLPSDLTTFEKTENTLTITNSVPTAFTASSFIKTADNKLSDVLSATPITIYPNNFYLISMLIKTEHIEKGKGLNVSLLSKNEDGKDYETQLNTLTSLSNLNSEDLKDYAIEDGFTEIKFFVKGGILKENNVGLSFTLGSGKATQSANHIIGKAIIQNIKIENVTSAEFSNASTDTVTATTSFNESAGSYEVSSNGTFKLIDASATKDLYKDIKNKDGEAYTIYDENGQLKDVLGVPSNWTISSKTPITKEDVSTRSRAGILDLNNSTLASSFGITDPNSFYSSESQMNLEDNRTVLAFDAKLASFGYSSNSISLNANSYYQFSVWAMTKDDARISIELATKTGAGKDAVNFYNVQSKDKWTKYTYYVRTGVSSVSVKLTLSVGNPTVSQEGTTGIAFFNQAKYDTMTEDQFNKAKENIKTNAQVQSWFVDSFDTTSPSSDLSAPNNWNGAIVDSEAKSDKDFLASGVFDKESGDWNNLDIKPDTNKDIYNAIFTEDENNVIGDSVLTIYNKKPTAYKYTSTATTLKENTYYKVSIYVLTYGLKANDSATITLKLNNQTYSFGKKLNDESTEYDKSRQINTSTYDGETEKIGSWKQYNFFIKTEKGVTPSASLTVALGYTGKDNWKEGYVFVDNFAVEEIKEEDFIARKVVEGETEETIDESLIADENLIPTSHRIVLTEEFANAEENKTEPEKEEETTPDKSKDLLWLWISSGIVGGVILLVLIVFLIKKYGKKKSKASKKSFKTKK